MLFDTPIISEGAAIVNTTVDSGTAYPANANPAEIFYRTDLNDFVFRTSTAWKQFANLTDFQSHANDNGRHLTTQEKALISGITVTASDINSIPQMKLDISGNTSNINNHKADMNVHITAAQNTFLDGLNLPTLTAANVNTLVGQTTLISTQFTNQTNATNAVAGNLATHIADQTVHVLPAQRTWLNGIDMVKITPAVINSLDTISAGGSAANRVLKTGDTMSGVLNMGGNKITNIALATVDSDAANKKYVDDKVAAFVPDLSGYVKKAGDTMTGNLNMGSKLVTGLGAPVGNTDAATKKYVDDLDVTKLAKTGGMMSGGIDMGNNKITNLPTPTSNGDATNKTYVDSSITTATSSFLKKTGDTMTGGLNMGANALTNLPNPINPGDATHKSYVDGKVSKTGDTMSGNLNMGTFKVFQSAVPAGTFDVTNKKYVDDAILAATSQPGPAESAAKLTVARDISLTGAATGKTATKFDGSADANIVVTSLDATKLNGQIPNTSLTTLGLSYVTRIWTGTDFNTLCKLDDVGYYSLQSSTSRVNGPMGGSFSYNGVLQVIRRGEAASTHTVTQILHSNQFTAIRFGASSGAFPNEAYVWYAWTFLTTAILGAAEDLDTILNPGVYGQGSNNQAAAGQNYPVPFAGILTVTALGAGIAQQEYTVYGSGTLESSGNTTYGSKYIRSYYSTSVIPWSSWRRVADDKTAMMLTGDQTLAGKKTFTGQVTVNYGGNATSLATAAIGTTGGIWSNMMGNFGGLTSRGNVEILGNAIELGETANATASYIDFHTSGVVNDYDSRIIATGGNGTNRNGAIEIVAGTGITLTGPVTLTNGATGSLTGNATTASTLQTARTFSITGGATAAGISFNGNGNVALNVTSLDATKLINVVPNASISGTYDGVNLKISNGNVVFTSPSAGSTNNQANTVYGMAEYRTSASGAIGCVFFTAPNANNNIMHTFDFVLRTHGGGDIVAQGLVSGYKTSTGWSNTKYVVTGTHALSVRLAHDATGKATLILADTNTSLPYVHATLRMTMVSHSGLTDAYVSQWTSGLTTDISAFTPVVGPITPATVDTKVASAVSADSVAKLSTPRKINTINFDGQNDINVPGWFSQPAMTAQTGSTRYNVQPGIYYDAIYQGHTMGYPITYGSRQLIAARNTGNAMAQHELVYEWQSNGKDRIFYRSIGDVSTYQWSDFKEIAFVDTIIKKSEGLICNTYSNATPLNLDDLAGASSPGFLVFGGISGLPGTSHINSSELPFAQNVDMVGFSLGYTHENMQLVFDAGIIKVRGNDANPGTSTTWSPWKQVAYTTDKLATAGIADSALALNTARSINGTSFNGTNNITTAQWGTARNITIGNTAKSVNGSGNVAWSLAEIGAAPTASPVFSGTIINTGNNLSIGSLGTSWINGTNGTKGNAAFMLADASSATQYHSWISQRCNSGVGYGIGVLGDNFFITQATASATNAGTNAVTNVLKYDSANRTTSFAGPLRLEYGTGEAQIYFSGGNGYLFGNSASIGFYNSSTAKGCSMDNNGNWSVAGDVIGLYSDERLKENITVIDNALDIIRGLDGVRYNANSVAGSFGYDTTKIQIGFKAQQVQKFLPELVEFAPFDRDENGESKSGEDYLTLKYDRMIPVLVEAIKEMDAENTQLKQQVASLEERLARLEALLS